MVADRSRPLAISTLTRARFTPAIVAAVVGRM